MDRHGVSIDDAGTRNHEGVSLPQISRDKATNNTRANHQKRSNAQQNHEAADMLEGKPRSFERLRAEWP